LGIFWSFFGSLNTTKPLVRGAHGHKTRPENT
jgi:hypothetical protein